MNEETYEEKKARLQTAVEEGFEEMDELLKTATLGKTFEEIFLFKNLFLQTNKRLVALIEEKELLIMNHLNWSEEQKALVLLHAELEWPLL